MSKILIVSNTDGAHYVFRGWLIKKLTQDGHCVDSLTLRVSPENIYKEKIKLISSKYYRIESYKFNILSAVMALIKIKKIISNEKYDIIHLYGHEVFALFWPFINHVNGTKVIVTLTGLGRLFALDADLASNAARKLLLILYKKKLHKIFKLIFLNQHDADKMNAILNSADKSVVIHGEGYVAKSVNFPSCALNKHGRIKVLFASRFMVEKGVLVLLESIKRLTHSNLQFILAGAIPEELKGNSLISELLNGKIKSTEYIGHVNNVPELLDKIDVVVLPTYYNEGAPRILIEALYAGKFIITTDAPGARETVVDNINGKIIKRNSIDDLVKALDGLSWLCIEKAFEVSINHFYRLYESAGIYRMIAGIYNAAPCKSSMAVSGDNG